MTPSQDRVRYAQPGRGGASLLPDASPTARRLVPSGWSPRLRMRGPPAWPNVKISSRRGVWGNRVSPRPRPREGRTLTQGDGETRCPHTSARGRVWEGAALPRSMFIPSRCGAAAWTAEVTIVRSVQPPSQPPPAGGRSRVPAPSGGGSGRGPSPCPRSRDAGETPALPGHGHRGGVRHAHDRLT